MFFFGLAYVWVGGGGGGGLCMRAFVSFVHIFFCLKCACANTIGLATM